MTSPNSKTFKASLIDRDVTAGIHRLKVVHVGGSLLPNNWGICAKPARFSDNSFVLI